MACIPSTYSAAYPQSRFAFKLPNSKRSRLPNLILEAMAKGLVIITTRVGSIPDVIIESENGYFVKVGNIHEIRKTLNLLLKDKSRILEISRKNIYKIKTNFSENKVVPNMINFLIN